MADLFLIYSLYSAFTERSLPIKVLIKVILQAIMLLPLTAMLVMRVAKAIEWSPQVLFVMYNVSMAMLE